VAFVYAAGAWGRGRGIGAVRIRRFTARPLCECAERRMSAFIGNDKLAEVNLYGFGFCSCGPRMGTAGFEERENSHEQG
jgi:hypothetical protein